MCGIVPAGYTYSTSVRIRIRTPSRQLECVCVWICTSVLLPVSRYYSRWHRWRRCRRRHTLEINLCSTKLLNKFYLTAYACDCRTDSRRRDCRIKMPEPGILHTFMYKRVWRPCFCPHVILIYLDHTHMRRTVCESVEVPPCGAHTFSHTVASHPSVQKCAKVHMFVRQASGRLHVMCIQDKVCASKFGVWDAGMRACVRASRCEFCANVYVLYWR